MNNNREERPLSYGEMYFRSRDERLLRKVRQLLELTRFGESEAARVIGAIERELEAMWLEARRNGRTT